MTILFASGELDAILPSESSVFEEPTLSPIGIFSEIYDAEYARCAIRINQATAYAEAGGWSSATTFWFHAEVTYAAPVISVTLLNFYSGSTEVFRVRVIGTTFQMQYLSAPGTFTNIGDSFSLSQVVRHRIDVKLVPATGEAKFYAAGTLRASDTIGNMSQFSGVTKARMWSASTAYWSQVLCSTTSTVGRAVSVDPATGNGANTAWTGDYTGIDEATYSDADGITSGTATQVETFTCAGATVNGFKVEGLAVCARVKCGETGPQNIQTAVRTSSTNYFSSTSALTLGFTGVCGIWEQNPNTTADWVTATAQAAEFGVKSIA